MDTGQEFSNTLLQFMEETFEVKHHGFYLDKGTSLLETLENVSAEQASISVGGQCASLAAQVADITFFIESFERFAIQGDNSQALCTLKNSPIGIEGTDLKRNS